MDHSTFTLLNVGTRLLGMLLKPVVNFGSPVVRARHKSETFWHVPISVHPLIFGRIGPATIIEAELYLDEYVRNDVVGTEQLCWGDISKGNPSLTTLLRKSDVRLVPVVGREQKQQAAFVADTRYFQRKEKTTFLSGNKKKQRYRLRLKSGPQEWASDHYYVASTAPHEEANNFTFEIDHERQPKKADSDGAVSSFGKFIAITLAAVGFLVIGYVVWINLSAPKDGTAVESVIAAPTWEVVERKLDVPFHIKIPWNLLATTEIRDCGLASMFWSDRPSEPPYIDISMDTLMARLDVADALSRCSDPVKAGDTPVLTAWPYNGYFKDSVVANVKAGGNKFVYVLAAWKYRLPNSDVSYMQVYCRYYHGTFDEGASCGERWNRATVHTGIVGVK